MNRVYILISCLILTAGFGCSKSELDTQVVTYGSGVTASDAIDVADFYANLDELEGQKVRVKGMVTDVCEKRGCWIKIGNEKEAQTVKFKVQDGVIVFPMSAKGKDVIAEGTVIKKELTMEQTIAYLKHEAEEHKQAFDPKSVKERLTIVMLKGIGAKITDTR